MPNDSILKNWPVYAALPTPCLLLSPDLAIVAVNDAYCKHTGLQAPHITAVSFFEAIPADKVSADLLRSSFQKVLEDKVADELQLINYGGLVASASISTGCAIKNIPGPLKGKKVSYIIHCVTPVVNQDNLFLKTGNQPPVQEQLISGVKKYAIFSLDNDGIITSWNKGAENIKGYKADEIVGKHISVLYNPRDIAKDLPGQNIALAIKNAGLETEGWRLRKNGQAFYAHITFTPLFNEAGEQYGFSKITRDITEERNDKERMSFLADITRNIEDPIITTDIHLNITRWNSAARRLFEWTAAEAIGRNTIEILQSQISAKERTHIQQSLTKTGYWHGELRQLNRSGKELNSLCTLSHLKDVEGKICGILILIKDITEHKRAAKQLARLNTELEQMVAERTRQLINTEKKYELLFNSNPMPLWVIKQEDFSFVAVNQMAIYQYGYSREEFLSMTAVDIRPDEEKEMFLASDHSFITTASSYNKGLWSHKKKNGEIIHVEVFAHDVMFENSPAKMILSVDVTARIKAEEELAAREVFFRSLIENSDEGISLTDENYRSIYRSPAAIKLASNLSSDNPLGNFHPEDEEIMVNLRRQLRKKSGAALPFMGRFKGTDESYMWLEGTVNNLLHVKGVNGIVTNFRVVTDRIEAQQKLLAKEKQFRHTMDNMLAGVQIHDHNWHYVYVNDALAKFSNATKEQLLGATLMEIHPGIKQTDVFKAMQRVMQTRITEQMETAFTFSDGRTAYFEVSIQPVPEGIFVLSVDVTERKLAQKENAKSQENYLRMMERISDAFVAIDTNWNYVYVNKAAGIILGKQPEYFLGKNMWNEFPEVVGQHFQVACYEALRTQQSIHLEEYYAPFEMWLDINIYPSPEGITIFFSNINQRKVAEQQVVESEANLKAIFDNTSEGFILTDREGNIKVFNDRVKQTMLQDVSAEIKAGLNIFQITEASRLEFFRHLMNQVLSGEKVQYDRQFDTVERQKLWINLSVTPVINGDNIDGVCITARDVTERRMGEELLQKSYFEKRALAEKLSAILNTLPANIALVDPTGRIIEVNDAWRNFEMENNFQGQRFAVGENYIDIAKSGTGALQKDVETVAAGLSRILKESDQEFVFEYPHYAPDMDKWYRIIATPLQNKQYAGAVIMHLDISEVRRLEAERLKLKQDEHRKITQAILKGQEKERNHIGQELHDNVNQILAGSRMYLSIAGNKDEQVKEIIRYPVQLLDQSVEEIRKLCANMVTPPKDLQLEELMASLLEKIQLKDIRTNFEYNVPSDAVTDELKLNLYRLLQEISNNILKYAGASQVDVYLGLQQKQIVLTVNDNGVGFDTRAKKNGIGLANMRSRVESFKGRLLIESSIGNGTKTSIYIPFEEREQV